MIDPDPLLARFDTLFDSFEEELLDSEAVQLEVSDPDPLLEKLDELLDSKIGPSPDSQEEIDLINEEGMVHYTSKIPPGYMDSAKGDDKEGSHYGYGGIVYDRQYGDLVIWKQTLCEAKNRGLAFLIFLTDDVKEDWWRIVNGKKIGARPELRDEISRIAGVTHFHIYNTEQFLRVSSEYSKVEVSEESIRAARDVQDIFGKGVLSPQQIVEDEMIELVNDLMNSDEQVIGRMAGTNAFLMG